MGIYVAPAAFVAFDARHWHNSYMLGIEKPMMDEAAALVGEFVAATDEVPEHQRQAAESIWGAVLESSYPDLIERLVSEGRQKPQHHTADGWRMDLVVDEDINRPVHKGLGVAMHRSVTIFPTREGGKELVAGRLSRDQIFRRDGSKATELFVWTRPDARRKGIASEVISRLDKAIGLRASLMLPDGYELDTETNQAGVRLVEKFAPASAAV